MAEAVNSGVFIMLSAGAGIAGIVLLYVCYLVVSEAVKGR